MGKKVVLDTSVFISALGWKGASHKIFNDCIFGKYELILSLEIFDELKRVLNYPKFKFSQAEIEDFLDQILEVGTLVEPAVAIEMIENDPSDNKFLECAITVDADYIISRDPHLTKGKEFNGIMIMSPENFREITCGHG
ncbi:MAG: putative toxin-antitoxin system toxin component, PIN family [Candidatus Schekmanbacteria bacterium]|nr:putative toxin-antitoxin system toxin component, PIN family [Candidatus Schekmanbacteria bacterium]